MFTVQPLNSRLKLKKFFRFVSIYGFERSFVKAVGRTRKSYFIKPPFSIKRPKKNVAIIGCGQFAFATIAYFLKKNIGNCIYGVYDIDIARSQSLSAYYGGKVFRDFNDLINDNQVEIIYIASNHASHFQYAIQGLKNQKTVYIEKPISVNRDQFEKLKYHIDPSLNNVFVGYNRPHAPAIKALCSSLNTGQRSAMSLSCFINTHSIPQDHWYRNPEEGTRVCGNLGHWIDLAIHLLNQVGLPNELRVSITSSSINEPDDNLIINLVSDKEDLINIVSTSRSEPFEGISETINFQHKNIIAKIDDFRQLTIWKSDQLIKKNYPIKDVGHQAAVLQPFYPQDGRELEEIMISTRLMIDIKDALLNKTSTFDFQI